MIPSASIGAAMVSMRITTGIVIGVILAAMTVTVLLSKTVYHVVTITTSLIMLATKRNAQLQPTWRTMKKGYANVANLDARYVIHPSFAASASLGTISTKDGAIRNAQETLYPRMCDFPICLTAIKT